MKKYIWGILLIFFWFLFMLFSHYTISIAAFLCKILVAGTISFFIIYKIIRLKKPVNKKTSLPLFVAFLLLILTISPSEVNLFIEKIDWRLLYNKRAKVVEDVKKNKLIPNENHRYQLNFDFPIVSNWDNEIQIYKNKETGKKTVEFYIVQGVFGSRSSEFVYSEDSSIINIIIKRIGKNPGKNWQLGSNWFRTDGVDVSIVIERGYYDEE